MRFLILSGVKVCCVVGFPLGAMSSAMKAAEALHCLEHGASEIDMVSCGELFLTERLSLSEC